MSLQDILQHVVNDSGPIILIILIATTLIQISPIKINPWGSLFKWIGKQVNTEVIEKINKVESRLDKHVKESLEAELRTRRVSILDFSSSVIRGVNYHKEKFDFMIGECDNYEKYCQDNNIKNGVAEASIAEIRRIYSEHLKNGDFLAEKGDASK